MPVARTKHGRSVAAPAASRRGRPAGAPRTAPGVAAPPTPRLIRGGPRPEWRLGELTVVVGAARAELRYAREPVGSCRPTPDAIIEAVQRVRARLVARSRGPDELLPALVAAYAAVLDERGARAGDRVPLVALRDQLAGYTRAQFAWDVARLRRERRLAVGGRRLDLGVATGHATARRSSVVWIENESGTGSYYQSFRLIPQTGGSTG
jgi:hypothetical protein